MPDGSEFFCPRCKVPLKEVRTSGGVCFRSLDFVPNHRHS
jgi:hypothetical protein